MEIAMTEAKKAKAKKANFEGVGKDIGTSWVFIHLLTLYIDQSVTDFSFHGSEVYKRRGYESIVR